MPALPPMLAMLPATLLLGPGEPERVVAPAYELAGQVLGATTTDAITELVVEAVPALSPIIEIRRVPEPPTLQLPLTSSTRRDFTTVVDLAPTAVPTPAGLSLAGTTGAESRYRLEGADLNNPIFGALGSSVVWEFVEQVDTLESGYAAEFGGAAGGQIRARRVSGRNQLRGLVGARVSPRLAAPRMIDAPDEALRVQEVDDVEAQLYALVSGRIVRDRLFFVVGFAPGWARSELIQSFHRVRGPNPGKFAEQRFATGRSNYAAMLGLDVHLSTRQQLRITAITDPQLRRTAYRLPHGREPNAFGNPRVDPLGGGSRVATGIVNDHLGTTLAHDTVVALAYTGRSRDDDVEVAANLGFSQFLVEDAWRLDNPGLRETTATQWTRDRGLDLAEQLARDGAVNLVPGVVEACEGEAGETACPVRTWLSGGLGEYDRDVARRVTADLGVTHFIDTRRAGSHQLGYGGAFAYSQRTSVFRYSGSNEGDFYDSSRCPPGATAGGEWCFDPNERQYLVDNDVRVNANRLILVDGDDPDRRTTWGFGRARHELEELRAITDDRGRAARAPAYDETVSSLDYAAYLQDRWAIRSNLIVQAGVRWELQDLRDIYGRSQALIWDNVAPRLGLIYDWTDEGRSRAYFHFGRFYQPLPLQLASRAFGGLIQVVRSYSARDCAGSFTTLDGAAHPRVDPREQPSEWCVDHPELTRGASGPAVVPRLRGQFYRQFQLGYDHEVIDDLVIGVRWLHSELGRAVEDLSPNGGLDFIVANPGVAVADRYIDAQRRECEQLESGTAELARCEFLLSAYQAVDRRFARPIRNFDAWTLSVQNRFTDDLLLFASYTYSRLRGNYDGYVDPISGAINLGASAQYDDPELIRNSFGPLAGDVPHRLKIDGVYVLDLGRSGQTFLGASVRAQSGAPVSVRVDSTLPSYRGAHLNYLLPRGAAGRLAPWCQLNLGVSHRYPLPRGVELLVGARVLNVTNAQPALRVDEVYSFAAARPIAGGGPQELAHAKRGAAPFGREIVRPQANFAVATRFGRPITAQLELSVRY